MKISRYLSPQVYKSIFSGQKDVDDPDRAQAADDLLLRHQGFHRHHRASAARGDDGAAQRIFHRDVGDRRDPRRHHRQVHRRRHADFLRRSRDARRGRRCQGVPQHGGRHAAAPGRAQCQMAQSKASSSRSASAWASIPATAMSAISAATTAWTTRSSAPRPISPRACNRSPSPARSSSATRPMRWCATS